MLVAGESYKMSKMLIYQNKNSDIKVDVRFEDNSIWLPQAQICELFGKAKSTISEHIKNIFMKRNLLQVQLFGSSE